jgi:hypothetical protein
MSSLLHLPFPATQATTSPAGRKYGAASFRSPLVSLSVNLQNTFPQCRDINNREASMAARSAWSNTDFYCEQIQEHPTTQQQSIVTTARITSHSVQSERKNG